MSNNDMSNNDMSNNDVSNNEEPEPPVRRTHLVDLSPLRESPAFARLWIGNAISGIGGQMTIVAVGLQIYHLTGSTFAVALVGGIALVPMIFAGLYGGMLADAFDRRLIMFVAACLAWCTTIALVTMTLTGVHLVWPFYIVTTVNAVAVTVIGAVRAAVTPRILPMRLIPAAAALTGISNGLMVTVGPAVAGVLVAAVGFAWTYSVDIVLFLTAFIGILSLPRLLPLGEIHRPGLESLRFGVRFLRTAPNIRMSFLVDIVAMTFGQPRVLFPALGALVLGGGPVTVGILTAAGAIGALVSSVFSGRTGQVRRQGLAIGWAITIYGAFIAGFGIVALVADRGLVEKAGAAAVAPNVTAIVVASVVLAGAGAADNISSIFRQTILQSAVPDIMRGRLQGVFTVVVTGGPRVGDLFVGVVAAIGALWLPPLLGGIAIIVIIAFMLRVQRTFRHYDATNPLP
ncbi:MAG TPA: MFS transporter [Galbitalea sp.]|nr:MFS transporter [Galbitalea sp.]